MKTLSIFFGLLACIAFGSMLYTLFAQPYLTSQTNDAVFAGMFLLGCICFVLFMWCDRLSNTQANR